MAELPPTMTLTGEQDTGPTDSPTFAGLKVGSLNGIIKGTAGVLSAITDNTAHWDSAWGWGNHASAGYLTTSAAASGYQPLDADLTAVAALSANGLLRKTAGTWGMDATAYQASHANLTSLAAMATTVGLVKQTAANTFGLDTTAYLTAEADTLATVTGRGAVTASQVQFSGSVLKAATLASSFATPPTAGARSDISFALGYSFQVSAVTVVTKLGRLYVAGNSQNHAVKLWISTNTATPLVSATILAASASDAAGYKWVDITPITLYPGNTYALAIDENSGGDAWKDLWTANTSVQTNITTLTARYSATQGTYPSSTNGANSMYDTGALWCAPGGYVLSEQANLWFDGTTLHAQQFDNVYATGHVSAGTTATYGALTAVGGTSFTSLPAYGTASIGQIWTSYWNGCGFVFTNATTGSQAFSMVFNGDTAWFGFLSGTAATNVFNVTPTLFDSFVDVNVRSGKVFRVNSTQVVGAQGAAVANATDAASAITQLNALLARLRAHGLIAT